MASTHRARSYHLFEEAAGDIPVFKSPSQVARDAGVGRIFSAVLWVLGALALARMYGKTAKDQLDLWALYGFALFVSIPAFIVIWYVLVNLWTRQAIIIHPLQGTISAVRRTPWSENARHYPLESVRAVRLDKEGSSWMLTIELLGDTFLYLGTAEEEENVRALAKRAAAILGVVVSEPEPETPLRSSAP